MSLEDECKELSPFPVMLVPEVAQVLRVSNKKVYDLVKSGDLRALKMGRGIRILTTSVNQFIRHYDNGGQDENDPSLRGSDDELRKRPEHV